jgi:hypothetical protein
MYHQSFGGHRNKYMEEKFHSKKFSHSHRVSISFQCIRSVLLSFFLCGISLPYIYFYVGGLMGGVGYFLREVLLKIYKKNLRKYNKFFEVL